MMWADVPDLAAGGVRGQGRDCHVCTWRRASYKTNGKGNNEIRIAYVLKQEDLIRAMQLLAMGIEAYNKKQAEISGAGKGGIAL